MNLRLIIPALALALAACAGGPQADERQQAQQQFLQDRIGTPAPAADPHGAPVFGTVERIAEGTLIIKNPIEGTTSTVAFTDETAVVRRQPGTLADLAPGTAVTALGSQEGTVFRAASVSAGDAIEGIVQPLVIQRGPGDTPASGGAEPADQRIITSGPNGVGGLTPLRGTVASASPTQLTITSEDGTTTTVELREGGQVLTEAPASVADLTAGLTILALVERDGSAVTARRITITER